MFTSSKKEPWAGVRGGLGPPYGLRDSGDKNFRTRSCARGFAQRAGRRAVKACREGARQSTHGPLGMLPCAGLHDSPRNSFDGAMPTCADWPVGGRCRLRITAWHGETQGVDIARLSHASEIEPQGLAGPRRDSDLGRDRDCRAPHVRPAFEPGFGNVEMECQQDLGDDAAAETRR